MSQCSLGRIGEEPVTDRSLNLAMIEMQHAAAGGSAFEQIRGEVKTESRPERDRDASGTTWHAVLGLAALLDKPPAIIAIIEQDFEKLVLGETVASRDDVAGCSGDRGTMFGGLTQAIKQSP